MNCTDSMRCAIAQIRPVLGNVDANFEKHVDYIRQAVSDEADVVVFPELGLTGYNLQDLTYDVALTVDSKRIMKLVEQSHDIDIVFSFVEEDERHSFYICSAYASSGQLLHVHRKVYLPTYGLFDEARYFDAGDRIRSFTVKAQALRVAQLAPTGKELKAGMLICEDAWHPSTAYVLGTNGAHIIYVLSASPARGLQSEDLASDAWWQTTMRSYAQLHGMVVVYVNRVGFEDGLGFAGGSAIYDADGSRLLAAPLLEEGLFCTDIDFRKLRSNRIANPLRRNEKIDLTIRELQRIREEGWR